MPSPGPAAEPKLPVPAGAREDEAFAHTRMSIGDHLEELRRRVAWALGVILIAFVPCYMAGDWLLTKLIVPIHSALPPDVLKNFRVIFTSPQESFMVYLEVSFLAAVLLSAPITFSLLWGFIATGLYPHEKKWVHVFAPASFVLFLSGVAFLYFLVMPWMLGFLIGFWNPPPIPVPGGDPTPVVQHTVTLSSYVSFFLWMSILMGLVFLTPLVQAFLALVGLVNPATFAAKRRHVIAGAVIVAAVITPPDVVSQCMTAAPFLLLYEVGIVIGRVLWRRRAVPALDARAPSP